MTDNKWTALASLVAGIGAYFTASRRRLGPYENERIAVLETHLSYLEGRIGTLEGLLDQQGEEPEQEGKKPEEKGV